MKKLSIKLIVSMILMQSTIIQAELMFQKPGSRHNEQWVQAGSDFLEGIAKIFEGLASLERKQEKQGDEHLAKAIQSLEQAARAYSRLAEEIKSDQTISPKDIPQATWKKITRALDAYKVSVPSTEQEAARLAANEVNALLAKFREAKARIGRYDLEAIIDLLSSVTRVERIGSHVALLMSSAGR